MQLDIECRDCLFNSQLKKVEREQKDGAKLAIFKNRVREICDTAPDGYCAPLLMRDIDRCHNEIFGCGIDYSREKSLFNKLLLNMEQALHARIISSADPIEEGLKFALTANYIDFARLSNLTEDSVKTVIKASESALIDKATLAKFNDKLKTAKTLCCLHDNCGEIVLDKILIRVIKNLYPQISMISVVRGSAIINDVTLFDAEEVGLSEFAHVIGNGTGIPGTYVKEVTPEVIKLLIESDVVISKGLGNLETLYGEGYHAFYAFNCKCGHIAERFGLKLWSAGFIYE